MPNLLQFIQWYKESGWRSTSCVFCQDFGVPELLTMDGAPDQLGRNLAFMKKVQKQGIDFQVIKTERHNQNPAEGII